jgi:hypothetical protein
LVTVFIRDQAGHENAEMTMKKYLGKDYMGSRAEWAALAV